MKTRIEIKGKGYILQHPGNRAWLRLQKDLLNVSTGQYDSEKMLDFCFEHVVFPEPGGKLNLDAIELEELEVWQNLLPRFLRNKLSAGDTGKGFVIADAPAQPPA